MGVDGFRFDLAAALARSMHDVDMLSPFLAVIAQDPVLRRVKLIAEPWDVGSGGYQVGAFPPLWTEWNDRYRDAVRDFWRGALPDVRDLGYRLSGSSDLYAWGGRRPYASVNFVTAHDGFTLRDLVSLRAQAQRGQRRGQPRRHRRQPVLELRRRGRDRRPGRSTRCAAASCATCSPPCCCPPGVPMLVAGDEMGRTQGGNNNAYCQDNEIGWLDWSLLDEPELAGADRADRPADRAAPRPSGAAPPRLLLRPGPGRRTGCGTWPGSPRDGREMTERRLVRARRHARPLPLRAGTSRGGTRGASRSPTTASSPSCTRAPDRWPSRCRGRRGRRRTNWSWTPPGRTRPSRPGTVLEAGRS